MSFFHLVLVCVEHCPHDLVLPQKKPVCVYTLLHLVHPPLPDTCMHLLCRPLTTVPPASDVAGMDEEVGGSDESMRDAALAGGN